MKDIKEIIAGIPKLEGTLCQCPNLSYEQVVSKSYADTLEKMLVEAVRQRDLLLLGHPMTKKETWNQKLSEIARMK